MIEYLDLLRLHGAWADAQLLTELTSGASTPFVAVREAGADPAPVDYIGWTRPSRP